MDAEGGILDLLNHNFKYLTRTNMTLWISASIFTQFWPESNGNAPGHRLQEADTANHAMHKITPSIVNCINNITRVLAFITIESQTHANKPNSYNLIQSRSNHYPKSSDYCEAFPVKTLDFDFLHDFLTLLVCMICA